MVFWYAWDKIENWLKFIPNYSYRCQTERTQCANSQRDLAPLSSWFIVTQSDQLLTVLSDLICKAFLSLSSCSCLLKRENNNQAIKHWFSISKTFTRKGKSFVTFSFWLFLRPETTKREREHQKSKKVEINQNVWLNSYLRNKRLFEQLHLLRSEVSVTWLLKLIEATLQSKLVVINLPHWVQLHLVRLHTERKSFRSPILS